jgi:hypothetical protein
MILKYLKTQTRTHKLSKKAKKNSHAQVGRALTCYILSKCIRFILQRNLLNKSQGFLFLLEIFMVGTKYPRDVKFQNSDYAVWFPDPNY